MAVTHDPLAPVLGRLAAPAANRPFDAIRLAMVDRLVRAHADGALDGRAWLAAWEEAVTAMRDRIAAEGAAALGRAAVHSRYPADRLARLIPDERTRETLLQRLLAEGIALERLEDEPDSLSTARRRGAALEAGWEAAVRLGRIESGRLATDAERVLAWRRPWRPIVVTGAVLVTIAALTAAMIGGLLPAPAWFRPVVDWFWGLPWP